MITFQVEGLRDIQEQLSAILPQHWEEIALNRDQVPLEVDWPRYLALADAGALHIVTARKEGELVGYHITIVSGHLHYASTLHGFTDIYFVKPEYRTGRTGLRMFRAVLDALKDIGVQKLFTATKLHLDQSRLLEYLGFHRTEYLYTIMIGD